MSEYKVIEFDDETQNKTIGIITGLNVSLFDGEKWSFEEIVCTNLIEEQFKFLRCFSIVEIPNQREDVLSTFLISGGIDVKLAKISKACFILEKLVSEDKSTRFQLDFGFADMSTPRYLHKLINANNQYFVAIAGKNNESWLNECEVFNFKEKKWQFFPNLNNKRSNFDSVFFQNKVFVFGGFEDKDKYSQKSLEFCDFNQPISKISWNVIETKIPLLASHRVSVNNSNNTIILFGGCDKNEIKNDVYEIELQSFSVKNVYKLKFPRSNFHVLTKGENFYVIGGHFEIKAGAQQYENYVEKFNIIDLNSSLQGVNKEELITNIGIETEFGLQVFLNEKGLEYSPSFTF